jgi:virginiamycin A acetyltransferase
MRMPGPTDQHPLVLPDGKRDAATVFLNQVIDHPNITIGDYTYAHDSSTPENYAARLAPYLYPGAPEHLKIGKFCQIAQGVQFITATANHPMDGISTYPFAIFDPPRLQTYRNSLPRGKDTTIGNDCWIGREAMLLPGASLGNGVIVGARAVVGGSVPDYTIVAGNPARIVRMRFSKDQIATLNEICWWDWDTKKIETAIKMIEGPDVKMLSEFFAQGVMNSV